MPRHPCPRCGRTSLGPPEDPHCGVCRAKARHRAERTHAHGGPRPGRAKAPVRRRACLRCDREFWSEGCHHRICDACRHTIANSDAAGETYRVLRGRWSPEPGEG